MSATHHRIEPSPVARPNHWLLEHARDVTSQTGEDGILEKVLEVIGAGNRWCVEFGAWDGTHLSNTNNLVCNHEYSAVLIEADAARFEALRARFRDNPRVIPLHAFVGFDEADGLDARLRDTPVPTDFDVLSIDIDGNDYHVWEAVREYRPRVVVIEFNPTIPDEIDFVQPRDPTVQQGSSLAALDRLAREKGYELVAVTQLNGIFVRREHFPAFEIRDNRVSELRRDRSLVTYVFNGYDGTVFVRGCRRMAWHGFRYDEARMQVLPKWLRQYPDDYTPLKRKLARMIRRLRRWGVLR